MKNPIDEINFSSLLRAQKKFETFRKNLSSEQEQAGAVQAFEFCYELAWKVMKRFLASRGIEVNSPREAFREAAVNHMIKDPEIWFDFLKKRNLTVHTYNEDNMAEIVAIFDTFSEELRSLTTYLEKNS